MIGGQRRHHGQGREDGPQRQHGFDAFARRHDVMGHTEADRVAEQMAHRPPRRGDRGFAVARGVEPGAVRARHGAGEIGDGGNQRRPGLDRCVIMRTVVAAGVEA